VKRYLKLFIPTIVIIFVFIINTGTYAKTYSLGDCINYALENSTDINRGKNSIESKESYLAQSKSALGPSVSLRVNQNTGSSNSNNYSNGEGRWNNSFNVGISASLTSNLTLYSGGKLKNTILINKSSLEASNTDIQTKKDNLSMIVLTAYINVLLTKEQIKNSELQLKSTNKQLEYAEVRKSAGIISKSDYLNIKSRYASEKADSVVLQNKLRLNLVSLMQTINMPVDNAFDIKVPDIQKLLNYPTETDVNKIYTAALRKSSEIETAEFNLLSAKTAINIAKADRLPTISLNGSIDISSRYNKSIDNSKEQVNSQISPGIGLSLSLPIFQRGQAKNQITQAGIQVKNSELNLRDVKNNLRKAIEQACIDAITANIEYEALKEQYEAEQESYNLTEEMFTQGLTNSVDYLTSKNNLVKAENNMTQAKYTIILRNKIITYYLGQPITL
jgi:outer membrane protein